MRDTLQENSEQLQTMRNEFSAQSAGLYEQKSQLQALSKELQEESKKWLALLIDSSFEDEQAFLKAKLPQPEIKILSDKINQLEQIQQSAHVNLQSVNDDYSEYLQDEKYREYHSLDLVSLTTELEQARLERDQLVGQQARLQEHLSADEQKRQRHVAALQKIYKLQQECDQIGLLNKLIGSKKGDTFRKFAQGLTLDHLTYLANQRLSQLHARYQLKRTDDANLELSVCDTWQGDLQRDTKTLSGGESFLVSLALALALSDLVSNKISIDSLFLDEGFGTLDSNTLDMALSALERLNASGKLIGVISHVDALKERIPTQIKVSSESGAGVSRLSDEYRVASAV
ncbi:SbcC/MukB-like Walker B domain-containing protein [Glaciecola sp. KUL10]|uniref:SbcC/MukB-like Walker B domain-containing protein n=1 Tax=Glaciecola sp. (strain KUL10) TaxID=2161813 RepID=UPI000D7863AB|nr:SbcC/MukB-like Walker B domain-containing protein [Glaciecola sp. KUL10]GBL05512.1 nuclease SbcCD subunit C [Glaciecola sp. KUL10]